jgi:hypothetical protein
MTDFISRRRALFAISGLIAAPFVIRNAGVLMPIRNRIDPAEKMPSPEEVQAWRASVTRNVERGRMISWTGEGFAHIHRMATAEKQYRALGLL